MKETGCQIQRFLSSRLKLAAAALFLCSFKASAVLAAGMAQPVGEVALAAAETGLNFQQEGWAKKDGRTYYYSLEAGEVLTGWQEIGGREYYFLPKTGEMATGWQEIDGWEYYFSTEDGWLLTGLQEINGYKYYFSPETAEMQAGWQKINGKKYYFSDKNGKMVTGTHKIGGSYYIFHASGQLAASGGVSLVTVGKDSYCAGKDGKAVRGWQLIGKKLYYATETGKVKKNTTYGGITFASNGAAKNSTNTKLKIKTMQVVASMTNSGMSKGEKLSACWAYMVSTKNFRYTAKYPDLDASGWQKKTAYDMLSSRSGNCYSFACAFAALAAEIGYEPYVICGRVHGSRDRAPDGYTRHAWVRINGKYYDPEAQFAGWMRGIYGKSSYPAAHSVQSMVAY